MLQTILGPVVVLVILGVVTAIVPMDSRIRNAVVAIVLLATALWILGALGIFHARSF